MKRKEKKRRKIKMKSILSNLDTYICVDSPHLGLSSIT